MTLTKKTTKKIKKILSKDVSKARIYIQATFNNTIISITDQDGNTIASSSAGSVGFKGARKATLYAAQVTMQNVLSKASNNNIKEVDIYISGVGSGRDSAIRSLQGSNIAIRTIHDITPIPHNGCRPRKTRRV